MKKGILEGNERIGLITLVVNDNAAANYRLTTESVVRISPQTDIFAAKRLKCNARLAVNTFYTWWLSQSVRYLHE